MTISTAESCTGGMVATAITSIPGASKIFQYGFVTYSEEAKGRILQIDPVILKCGAVSPEVAEAMAAGAREISRADFAVAVTGFAGPEGGTPLAPVGTGFIAIAGGKVSELLRKDFTGDRQAIREKLSEVALKMALEYVTRL